MGTPSTQFRQSGSFPTDKAPVVFVVDDDISVRQSLEMLIRCVGWSAESFASATEFLERAPAHGPCCLLLDVNLPDLNGLDLQARVAADRTDMPIIVITGCGDIPMTVKAMKAGAVEFLSKPFDGDTLLTAIQQALMRSRSVLEQQDAIQSLKERYDSLTQREREVMTLVVAGLLNKQIGSELGVTEITVKAHRGRVMKKMRARSLPSLVTMGASLGLPRPRR